jgi:hypothetical protein
MVDESRLSAGSPEFVSKGSVRYVEDLGGRWAPNPDYGRSIVRDYLTDMLGR